MLIIDIIKEKGEQQRRLEFHNIPVTLYKKIRVLYRELVTYPCIRMGRAEGALYVKGALGRRCYGLLGCDMKFLLN
jgi:hypothetical protein